MNPLRDYSPTKETISLHGLGFIQVKLPANRRLHVWHPDLPRRDCFRYSSIHNHRFAFRSTVLVGNQLNQRCDLVIHPEGTHDVISHDGPRSEKGGRESFVAGRVNIVVREVETYGPGEPYEMRELEYHSTPNNGVVVTLMKKLHEGTIHACSVLERPHAFHQDFDRFQWSPERLWQCVVEALGGIPRSETPEVQTAHRDEVIHECRAALLTFVDALHEDSNVVGAMAINEAIDLLATMVTGVKP